MNFLSIKTRIFKKSENIFTFFLEHYKNHIKENNLLIVSSKIVALSQNRVSNKTLMEEVKNEADEILNKNKYNNFYLTIKNGIVIPNSGIDTSNSKKGEVILWPENIQNFTNTLRNKFKKFFKLKNFGVAISDSRITMRRKGTTGIALSWSGFYGIKNEIGKKDLFGNKLKISSVNIADNLVSGSEVLMGQANESIPFVLVENLDKNLFTEEKQNILDAFIDKKNDLFK
jgi:F420-0:gamma-glutamyl ligase